MTPVFPVYTAIYAGILGLLAAFLTVNVIVNRVRAKVDFGDGWHDLIANVVPFVEPGDDGPARSAHAWLITPPVATA